MILQRVTSKNDENFNQSFSLYLSAFPADERREETEHLNVLKKSDFHSDAIIDEGKFIGILMYWEAPDFIFLEHFATLPEVRGKGKGKIALDKLKQKGKPVILEIENPIDEITERRYAFYRRNGFIMNDFRHVQARYHLGDDDVELKLLSYPEKLSEKEYLNFEAYLSRNVAIKMPVSKVTVRPMTESDDKKRVAEFIYESDNYIYPYWFDSKDDAVKVISEMIDGKTLYNYKNVTVAEHDGKIIGALVSLYSPIIEKEENILKAFRLAGVKADERTHKIFNDYYALMAEHKDGYYLANVTVDKRYRSSGVASKLITEVLKGKGFSRLECVKENVGAWRLYERLGFKIINEYPGVFGVPCYYMEKE